MTAYYSQPKLHSQAYRAVRTAIEMGILKRPKRCQECGTKDRKCKDGRPYIQAHHYDYRRQLEVKWICFKCHRQETPKPFGKKNGMVKHKDVRFFGDKNPMRKHPERRPRGENHGKTHLTNKQALSIKYSRSPIAQEAKRYGVSPSTISRIRGGTAWKHLAAIAKLEQRK